jgi:hypothetical protein
MSIPPQMQQELEALGIAPDMLGPADRLVLPAPGPHAALDASSPAARGPLLPTHSPVMEALGLEMEIDPGSGALRVISRGAVAFQVRPGLQGVQAEAADEAGIAHVTLQQTGRFLIETAGGTPLVLGWKEAGAVLLSPVFGWPTPSVEEWIVNTQDTWMQTRIAQAVGADAWARTSLAGQLARLCAPEVRDVAALIASGRLQDLVSETELAPRRWARALDPVSTQALEQQAIRRAEALGDDLTDLFETLSADMTEASATWARLCHRRDDIESVRVLLREAGTGTALEAVLTHTDRTGRAIRINLDGTVSADDERLRRVALGDPSAWWGSTDFEAHYF